MKPFTLSFMLKGAIVVFGLCGIIMCVLWYPFAVSFEIMGVVDVSPTPEQQVALWTQLLFYWGVSVPCFLILAFSWKITDAIKNDAFFSYKIAKKINFCAMLLFVDVIIFFIGNTVFLLLNWSVFVLVYYIIAVVGLAVASVFAAIAHFVSKAAKLKEETEGLI